MDQIKRPRWIWQFEGNVEVAYLEPLHKASVVIHEARGAGLCV